MSRLLSVLFVAVASPAFAADPPPSRQYLDFVKAQAAALRKDDKPPATKDEWATWRTELRKHLLEAWGGFPETPCPLEPKKLGELKRDGYTIEKLVFQTRPGIWMTANAYVPHKPGKLPAILQVHGHWRGAKQDPVVQSRCIGAAKLGFFVLCVDAFGAGERGVSTALGEYHGEMTAATLLPVGLPLSGLQVYENTRAVDYLLTRPEVDGERIGITGASGGGNQTMYAAAWDERIKAAVPVCSVGNYQAYLGAACCMCEVVPGALTFTEEWGLLALVAPRALMVISATKDAHQFSVGEAKKSLALAEPVFKLLGKPGNVRHTVFESGHDYSKPMREAMYGWMALHLKGEGDGSPIPEPAITTEDPEALRCYPGDTRPKDWVTLPRFAAAEGKKLVAAVPEPATAEAWTADAAKRRAGLVKVLGGFPKGKAEGGDNEVGGGRVTSYYTPEPGIWLNTLTYLQDVKPAAPLVIVLDMDGKDTQFRSDLFGLTHEAGWWYALIGLRATGQYTSTGDKIGRAPDHNSAEWAIWIGRPLLGQWVHDVRQGLDRVLTEHELRKPGDIVLVGEGPAGLVALAVAAVDPRVTKVAAVGTLASYVSDEPYVGQRLGVMAPGVLRHVGDVPHLAALAAPRRVVIAGGVAGNGKPVGGDALKANYRPAAKVWEVLKAEKAFVVLDTTDPAAVAKALADDEPIFAPDAKLKVEAEGDAAGEGPAWDPELGVLTSGAGNINRLARDGKSSVHRAKAGTNGLLFDRDGSLLCCEPAQRRVTRLGRDGTLTVLTDKFDGKRYNTPNDITVDSKGRVYFSDPRYGPRDDMQIRDDKGNTIEGVYRIDRDDKVARVIGREVERANGVLVSADDKFLYVADNNNDTVGGARKLWRFDLKPDGSVDQATKKLVYDWGKGRGPDGVKQDAKGRLYVAAGLNKPTPAEPDDKVKGGVYVIDPESGKLLAFLAVPRDEVTNCAFGGDDLKTLHVTGGGTLYSVRTTTPGRVVWPK